MISIFFTKKTYSFLLLFISFLLAYLNFQQREYDWDMPGYLATYYQMENPTQNKLILEKVYSSIKNEATDNQYDKLVGYHQNGNWRNFISKNANAFQLQIPYYSIKVFYVFLIFVFHKIGFSTPISIFLPNIISFFILGFLLFSILKKLLMNKIILSFILTIFLLFIPPLRYLATSPTPDMLAILLMIWFFYSVLNKHKLYIQFMILLLVMMTRPDYIIFGLSYLGIYVIYDFVKIKKVNLLAVLLATIMFSIYFLILKVNYYPAWKDVFYDTFIQRREFVTGTAQFTFQEYQQIILANIVNFKKVSVLAFLFLGTIFSCSKDFWIRIFAIVLFINIYLKFMFFPTTDYRFYIAFLLLLFITAISSAHNKISNLTA